MLERFRTSRRSARWAVLGLLGAACAALAGCSILLAARQPAKKDLYVLAKGTPRSDVVEELGPPVLVEDDPERDHCHELHVFRQGYSIGNRVVRVVGHAAADVFTFGAWELVGAGLENRYDGTEIVVEVLYDEEGRVDATCLYGSGLIDTGGSGVSPDEILRRYHEEPESDSLDTSEELEGSEGSEPEEE